MRHTLLCKAAGHHNRNAPATALKSSPFFSKPTHTHVSCFNFCLPKKLHGSKLSWVVHENRIPGIYYHRQIQTLYLCPRAAQNERAPEAGQVCTATGEPGSHAAGLGTRGMMGIGARSVEALISTHPISPVKGKSKGECQRSLQTSSPARNVALY